MADNTNQYEFIKKFRSLFEKIEQEVRDQEKKSNVFSRIKNYSIDSYSLVIHFPYYAVKKMNNLKTTAEELEYNKLIKETWYRNEERLFRVLAKMLISERYIELLESDSFKSFIEEKSAYDLMPEEVIGLTMDFIESTYFTDLVKDQNFVRLVNRFFYALPENALESIKSKLNNLEKRLSSNELKYGGSDSSMADQIKGGLGVAGGFIGGFAIGLYISVCLALTVAAVPAILYAYNYYKLVQTKAQKDNVSILRQKIGKLEETEKKNKSCKDHKENEK